MADGENGLAVLQLTSPDSQPKFYGFSPEPRPELIAWRGTNGAALSLSRGLERDRAVDETGHQIAVFGRIGSRPFTLPEMQELYLDEAGDVFTVSDDARPGGQCQHPRRIRRPRRQRRRAYFAVRYQTPSQSSGGGAAWSWAQRCCSTRAGPSSGRSSRHAAKPRSASAKSRSR